ncbi:MAG: DNA repair protein RecO [Pseudomonadota bacterium]
MQSVETAAFVIKISSYGEAHKIVTLATQQLGLIQAVARHARKSRRRYPGALDYFKLLTVECSQSGRGELWNLGRAVITHYYAPIVQNLDRYIAGCWVIENFRIFVPLQLSDPLYFAWLRDCLDYFETGDPDPASVFAAFIILLRATGNIPSFDACVSCGKEAPETAGAYFEAQRGGVVCRKCGGRRNLLQAGLRRFLVRAARAKSVSSAARVPEEMKKIVLKNKPLLRRLINDISLTITDKKNFSASLLFKRM